jgi:hypothetical protein
LSCLRCDRAAKIIVDYLVGELRSSSLGSLVKRSQNATSLQPARSPILSSIHFHPNQPIAISEPKSKRVSESFHLPLLFLLHLSKQSIHTRRQDKPCIDFSQNGSVFLLGVKGIACWRDARWFSGVICMWEVVRTGLIRTCPKGDSHPLRYCHPNAI